VQLRMIRNYHGFACQEYLGRVTSFITIFNFGFLPRGGGAPRDGKDIHGPVLRHCFRNRRIRVTIVNGQPIAGSPYSFGTFNFGLRYQISQSTRLNLSVGIGAGPNTPAAKALFELPYIFSL
jgi:hypothetical protein